MAEDEELEEESLLAIDRESSCFLTVAVEEVVEEDLAFDLDAMEVFSFDSLGVDEAAEGVESPLVFEREEGTGTEGTIYLACTGNPMQETRKPILNKYRIINLSS